MIFNISENRLAKLINNLIKRILRPVKMAYSQKFGLF